MYYNNGSPNKPQGSFYLKCDHPEGVDAKVRGEMEGYRLTNSISSCIHSHLHH
jgi:hypothetical protein